jgi:mercuric ion transport protein
MGTTVHDNRLIGFASLFASVGTMLCCALPALLVLLGLGATVASFLSAAPWLVALSHHKVWVFSVSGVLIAANFGYLYWLSPRLRGRGAAGDACAVDGSACDTASRFSRVVLWISAGLYLVGFFTAFVLGQLLARFG